MENGRRCENLSTSLSRRSPFEIVRYDGVKRTPKPPTLFPDADSGGENASASLRKAMVARLTVLVDTRLQGLCEQAPHGLRHVQLKAPTFFQCRAASVGIAASEAFDRFCGYWAEHSDQVPIGIADEEDPISPRHQRRIGDELDTQCR